MKGVEQKDATVPGKANAINETDAEDEERCLFRRNEKRALSFPIFFLLGLAGALASAS